MASLHQQAQVSAAETFIDRVRMALLVHAQYRVAQGDDAQGLVTLGRAILGAPVGYAQTFAQVVATTSFVQDGIATAPTTGEDVTDAQIISAIETVYPSFVR